MKVHHQFTRAIWDLPLNYLSPDHNSTNQHCKRLRPLIPKLSPSPANAAIDLKSFIRPDVGPRKPAPPPPPPRSDERKDKYPQVETTSHPGGTRWNPTQEQIGILEMLYRGGMRTPNAQQIEQTTAQLSKYGKIEGKNVFYWFQNHKARERQKRKRTILALSPARSTTTTTTASSLISSPTAINTSITLNFEASTKSKEEIGSEEQGLGKRKCRKWTFECLPGESPIIIYNHGNPKSSTANLSGESEEEDEDEDEELGSKRTLKLFPLHPEGMMGAVSTD